MQHGKLVTISSGLGLNKVPNGKEKDFCFEAIHTHDETGMLHIDSAEGNDLYLANFLTKWMPELNLGKAEVRVNGKRVSAPELIKLEPEMDIKIFLGTRH